MCFLVVKSLHNIVEGYRWSLDNALGPNSEVVRGYEDKRRAFILKNACFFL